MNKELKELLGLKCQMKDIIKFVQGLYDCNAKLIFENKELKKQLEVLTKKYEQAIQSKQS